MFRKLARGRKKYGLRRSLKRELFRQIDKILFPLNRETLVSAFRRVGVAEGATICVHSSLSRLGYVDGGADAVVDALMETVGKVGCILMPCFSMGGSMASYLNKGQPFDVRKTPSQVGVITEVFRKRPRVFRSLHVTNSLAAWGKDAKKLLLGHEKSLTPYSRDTPYGRLAGRDDTYILMLETHLQSLLHHLQERVNFPNLYLFQPKEASIIDENGVKRTVTTKVIRPRVPYFIAIPSLSGDDPDWVILHDFAVMFPGGREREVKRLGYHFEGYPRLYRRRNELERAGILRSTKVGKGEIGLLHIKSFLDRVEPELRDLIERFYSYYDSDRIATLNLPYS